MTPSTRCFQDDILNTFFGRSSYSNINRDMPYNGQLHVSNPPMHDQLSSGDSKIDTSQQYSCVDSRYTNLPVLIKTGNALYDDIEYYEYHTVPSSSVWFQEQRHCSRPPRTPPSLASSSSSSKTKQKQSLSDFSRSAYLTTSPR
jgi:hypothetical protein